MKRFLTNKILKNYLIITICLFSIELLFKAVEKMSIFDWSTLRIFLSVSVISLLFSIILSFCKRWIANIITFILIISASIYAIAQCGFENFLGVYISINTSSQLGAVTEYIRDYLASFNGIFYIILIPLILLIIYTILDAIFLHNKTRVEHTDKENWISRGVAFGVMLLFSGIFYWSLSAHFMQNDIQLVSTKALFKNPSNPNITANQMGIELFAILDVKTAIFPVDEEKEVVTFEKKNNNGGEITTDYARVIDDNAWETYAVTETNTNYKNLNNYFMNRDITPKNEYTGMFEGKNLVVIMLESVNNILLNEEYYPNFAKLYKEGWYWENAYSPRNSCSTGNNEMTGMTSLFSVYRTCTANVYKNNKYNESIFGLFNDAGYTTSSYHDYTEKYYFRSTIHKNMGSGAYYGVTSLGIDYNDEYKEWPSDVLLMDKSSEIFTQNTPFMAWVTTVSPHQPYYADSELSKLYFNDFSKTGYSSNMKRYMSKLKVLDDSLGELMKNLEEKELLDDTVFVMYADHYPYGLATSDIQKAFDYTVTKQNEIDRTPFVIYNSKLTPQVFSEYTSYVNIVPTVANLFGLDYDPRLYMGTDLLSETYDNKVIFADGSWQTPIGFYHASTGRMTYYGEEKYTNEEIVERNTEVSNMIKYSNLAITTNYFDHINKEIAKYKDEETHE